MNFLEKEVKKEIKKLIEKEIKRKNFCDLETILVKWIRYTTGCIKLLINQRFFFISCG